jgi:hypothetical protein
MMVYDNNDGPIYSSLDAKSCSAYCLANSYIGMCSDTVLPIPPGMERPPGACVDDEGVDCFTVNGRYCCCNA